MNFVDRILNSDLQKTTTINLAAAETRASVTPSAGTFRGCASRLLELRSHAIN